MIVLQLLYPKEASLSLSLQAQKIITKYSAQAFSMSHKTRKGCHMSAVTLKLCFDAYS